MFIVFRCANFDCFTVGVLVITVGHFLVFNLIFTRLFFLWLNTAQSKWLPPIFTFRRVVHFVLEHTLFNFTWLDTSKLGALFNNFFFFFR